MRTWRVLFFIILPTFSPAAEPVPQEIQFKKACTLGESFTISAVGDILLHQSLQEKGFQNARQGGFRTLWPDALPIFKAVDFSYANLEGPVAQGVNAEGEKVKDPGLKFDNYVYQTYPKFNYPPSLIQDLFLSGIDVISTANNHALDRGVLGLDRTIHNLQKNRIAYSGTRASGNLKAPWGTVVARNGFKTLWISCTYATNGGIEGTNQVLHCYSKNGRRKILKEIRAQRPYVDAVIVTPHWGTEYSGVPDQAQKKFAHQVLEAGADAVLGSHPHVVQPFEKYVTRDGRETFIAYSLGNFVSAQPAIERRTAIVLLLGFTRDQTTRRSFLNGVRFVPTYMEKPGSRRSKQLHLLGKKDAVAAKKIAHLFKVLPRSQVLYKNETLNTHPECSQFISNVDKPLTFDPQ